MKGILTKIAEEVHIVGFNLGFRLVGDSFLRSYSLPRDFGGGLKGS
jgi:hypothetical protein